MPDKPSWCANMDDILCKLRSLPDPWVDRPMIEELLGVGRRRAQQILAPCVTRQIGSNGLADRDAVIAHLERLAAGETAWYEQQRRRRLAAQPETLRQAWTRQPRVLVEAPLAIVNQELGRLPAGVSITPGQITLQSQTVTEALEKLLALAMAIGNDQDGFERLASPR